MGRFTLPPELAGHFLGVGSLVESYFGEAMDYVLNLALPYAYQRPKLPEEDMIRQFGALLDGFERDGTFIYDITLDAFNEMIEDEDSLFPEKTHFHSLYDLKDKGPFTYFKAQVTAPASMCYSIRDSSGLQHLTPQMFRFFASLIERVGKGYLEHFRDVVKTLFVCVDDPALGFVVEMIEAEKAPGLTPKHIMKVTDGMVSQFEVPLYHYCYDWRALESEGIHLLWESSPKIAHLDMVSYPPDIEPNQAELINRFLEQGGGIALGVLPNNDSAYEEPVLDVFKSSLTKTLNLLNTSGVDLNLLENNSLVSTQCGLSGASPQLSREIHLADAKYPEIVSQAFRNLS